VLKAEDNSRWIMAATQLSPYSDGSVRPGSSAGGGYLLDYLIGIIRFVTVGGNSKANSDPATAYLVVVNIYYVVLLVSFVLIAAYAFYFLREFVSKQNSYLASAGVVFLLFPTLSIVFVNYGHLSLLVAILFFWATCFLLLLETTNTNKNTRLSLASALISLGIMGGWWPAIPITVSILLFTLFRVSGQLKYASVRWTKYLLPLGLVFLLYFPLKGIRPLSNMRVFYSATGGVIPFTNLNSLLCVLGLAFVTYVLTNYSSNSLTVHPMVFPFVISGLYAFFLIFSSEFVGPNFTAAYSAQKVLAFFVIGTSPLIIVSIMAFLSKNLHVKSGVFGVLLTYLFSMICFGSHWNFPQKISQPIWSQTLIDIVRKYPGSPIVCASSQEALRGDAYICTRHAESVSYRNLSDNSLHGRYFQYIWRTMVVAPRSSSDQAGFPIKEEYDLFQKDSNAKVPIVISLDPSFAFMQADTWWMNTLPWDQFLIFEAETGKLLQGATQKLTVQAYDPRKIKLAGVGPGFIDKIDLGDGSVRIYGWADFGEEQPELILRNTRDIRDIETQLFVRSDISNPTVRGFEISYKIANQVKNGYCPLLVLGKKHWALTSSDPEC
jgi:hypothetical protein